MAVEAQEGYASKDTPAKVKTMKESQVKAWNNRLESSRRQRKKLEEIWKRNVNYRRGKPFATESEEDRIAVPADWSLTKAKIASLFSIVPQVQLTPKNPAYANAVPVFATCLNDVVQHESGLDVAMEEVLADVVNAAGVGAIRVAYQATTEKRTVPNTDLLETLPPEQQMLLIQTGRVPTMEIEVPVSEKFCAHRISPSRLLWPAEFRGSSFDNAPWVGWEGSLTLAQAQREFKLTAEQIAEAKGSEKLKSLNEDADNDADDEDLEVTFSEIFYKCAVYDENEKHLDRLKRVVFVGGIEKPVVFEDYKGQEWNEDQQKYVGVCGLFPIQCLTLDYVSDQAIPPSSSEVGRPMVDEMMRTRAQLLLQRERSMPLRWMDVNRIDPQIAALIMAGEWQDIIPVEGRGDMAIGEVSRAAFPREDFEADRIAKEDLEKAWSLGPNQLSGYNPGKRSASESNIVQSNFNVRLAFERAKVAKFFTNVVSVLAGLMQLYYDAPNAVPLVGEQGEKRMAEVWDRTKIAGEFVYTIRPDSTVLPDAQDRVNRLMQFANLTLRSGHVVAKPLFSEIAALFGLDPAEVIKDPPPPSPPAANVSYRASGRDMADPVARVLTMAMLLQTGQAPTAETLEAAKLMVQQAEAPPQPPQQQQAGTHQMPDGSTMPDAQMPPPTAPPSAFRPMERIVKRTDEI